MIIRDYYYLVLEKTKQGFDNSFFFTIIHTALLIEQGKYILPENFIINEFYLLDNFKFSTSMNHVIWARDILKQVSIDELRFFLSYSNPELYQANFNFEDLKIVSKKLLLSPIQNICGAFNKLLTSRTFEADYANVSGYFKEKLNKFHTAFNKSYGEELFSLTKSAHLLAEYVQWLSDYSQVKIDLKAEHIAHEVYFGLISLAQFSYPLLPNMSTKLKNDLHIDSPLTWDMPFFRKKLVSNTSILLFD